MQNGIEKTIEMVKIYKCGYCINNEKSIYTKGKNNKVKFPALSFLIKHKKEGYILVDTGYSEKIYDNGIISKLYNILNPATISIKDRIDTKLKNDNINIKEIKNIIISHLHPDHIGALYLFENTNKYLSIKCKGVLNKKENDMLIFKNLLPKNNENIEFIENCNICKDSFLNKYFDIVYDLFNDKSILIVNLEGHSKEQIGIYITDYNLFLIADTTWNSDRIQENIKNIPKLIQNNFKEFDCTINKIIKLKKENQQVILVASHDQVEEGIFDNA